VTTRALVPLKKLARAKSRLAGALPPHLRRRLVLHMANHVIGVLRETVDQIFMLTEEMISEFADLTQLSDTGAGLNPSLARAAQILPHAPGDVLIVIFPDLPLLTPPDVGALMRAGAGGVAVAADYTGDGTNALALGAPETFQFCFGPRSRYLHEAQAMRATVVHRDGLAFDVDDASQLHLCPAEFQEVEKLLTPPAFEWPNCGD
jgi:2-phospho-L-lactate guanylyltransferase